jgi:hypothetical protein
MIRRWRHPVRHLVSPSPQRGFWEDTAGGRGAPAETGRRSHQTIGKEETHEKSGIGLFRCFVVFGLVQAGNTQPPDPNAAEAKAIVTQFFGQLKGELQAAIKEGGPVNAVKVCQQRAPAIARDLSAQTGWDVARTSLKLRNPANQPDAWELAVLNKFEERKAAGEDPAQIAYGKWSSRTARRYSVS